MGFENGKETYHYIPRYLVNPQERHHTKDTDQDEFIARW